MRLYETNAQEAQTYLYVCMMSRAIKYSEQSVDCESTMKDLIYQSMYDVAKIIIYPNIACETTNNRCYNRPHGVWKKPDTFRAKNDIFYAQDH